jgi:hypothetical protein
VRARRTVTGLAVIALAATAVGVVLATRSHHDKPSLCTATAGTDTFTLDLDQAANAATITAVAKARDLPDHAVTVALAAAMQESKLRNLDYGDRDSVGLFQQRPSQGWGPRSELLDPVFAANAFYSHLVRVSGWTSLDVATAAQRVQHSADGSAYAQWEFGARTVARVLTGEVPSGFTCQFAHAPKSPGASLTALVDAQLGSDALAAPLPASRGWLVASWLVAHAYELRLRAVSYAGKIWTNTSGSWRADSAATTVVRIREFNSTS